MTRTVLIDLDDTLLHNSMERFLPAYFQRLGAYLSDLVEPDRMITALMSGTQAMLANSDPTTPLERKFSDIFYPDLALDEGQLQDRIRHFYTGIFPELEPLTGINPDARMLIEHLFDNHYEVVIATNPLFPRLAIEARLRWARLPVEEFDYALVTSYEDFHFAKPHPAYLTEILGMLGRPLADAVMIGNDVAMDLDPADQLGLPVFHLHDQPVAAYPGGDFLIALEWLQTAPEAFRPRAQRDPNVITARLKGHLAALLTHAKHCPGDTWSRRPQPDEWAPVEIFAHFADVEAEVNLARLRRFEGQEEPHLTAFDTDVWAEERRYLKYDPEDTLSRFVQARLELIGQLESLDPADWERKGVHSLLGPTTLAEVMHFAGEHDLLHLAQMRRAIGFPP